MSDSHYASTPPQCVWLLLDVPSMPDLGKRFQKRFGDGGTQIELLADGELDLVREHGPLLVYMTPGSSLSHAFPQEARDWPGLFIVCQAPKEILLAHLRRMLTVRFSDHYKGLLTYYNVQTASYFFDAMDPMTLSRWLGPIDSLMWFGGTWADKVDDIQGRQFVLNPRLDVTPLVDEPRLGAQQEKQLQQCLLERHAYYWSQSMHTDYRKALHYLHEGLRHGFNDSTILDEWLALRARFPAAPLPKELPGEDQRTRIQNLTQIWRGRGS
ncbi:DUF4123 domain-containing protein [Pseudomonas sp. NA-150]|uniref:DUF4123 domain-containing protein n=1 Tax=Pseudomonas sp. NA-150 TaxID=3367525 RepID=UPI0037C931A7